MAMRKRIAIFHYIGRCDSVNHLNQAFRFLPDELVNIHFFHEEIYADRF